MKRVLTGLQPTNVLTIGNYIGAIKQMLSYQDNYESFISMDLSEYAGKWVSIDNGKVIAEDYDFKKVFRKTKELIPNKRPFITKVRTNVKKLL